MLGKVLLAAAVILASLASGCREQLQVRTPALEGEELVIATALRKHISNRMNETRYDYKYIFISVLGKDPGERFLEYFGDLFAKVMPGSAMEEGRWGYEELPQTKGIWARFEVTAYESSSETEALVTCLTREYGGDGPEIKYVLRLVDGMWRAVGIAGIEQQGILR